MHGVDAAEVLALAVALQEDVALVDNGPCRVVQIDDLGVMGAVVVGVNVEPTAGVESVAYCSGSISESESLSTPSESKYITGTCGTSSSEILSGGLAIDI